MATRYCPRCAGEVEDTGGYCLLGHKLMLEAPSSSLSELRAEVDKAFDDAEREVADALSQVSAELPKVEKDPAEAELHDVAQGPTREVEPTEVQAELHDVAGGPTPLAPSVYEPEETEIAQDADEPMPVAKGRALPAWEELESDFDMELEDDPITNFAPPPRMDWGPRRSRLLRGRLERAGNEPAAQEVPAF